MKRLRNVPRFKRLEFTLRPFDIYGAIGLPLIREVATGAAAPNDVPGAPFAPIRNQSLSGSFDSLYSIDRMHDE
jgi:hypothetical protein